MKMKIKTKRVQIKKKKISKQLFYDSMNYFLS